MSEKPLPTFERDGVIVTLTVREEQGGATVTNGELADMRDLSALVAALPDEHARSLARELLVPMYDEPTGGGDRACYCEGCKEPLPDPHSYAECVDLLRHAEEGIEDHSRALDRQLKESESRAATLEAECAAEKSRADEAERKLVLWAAFLREHGEATRNALGRCEEEFTEVEHFHAALAALHTLDPIT